MSTAPDYDVIYDDLIERLLAADDYDPQLDRDIETKLLPQGRPHDWPHYTFHSGTAAQGIMCGNPVVSRLKAARDGHFIYLVDADTGKEYRTSRTTYVGEAQGRYLTEVSLRALKDFGWRKPDIEPDISPNYPVGKSPSTT